MTFRIERSAYCPCCGQAIQGRCSMVLQCVVVCELCFALPDCKSVISDHVFGTDAVLNQMCWSRGLFFYCPHDSWDQGKSAVELSAEADDRRRGISVEVRDSPGEAADVLELTTAGEVVLADEERRGRCGPAAISSAGADGARSA